MELWAGQFLAKQNLPGSAGPVQLKYVLCQVYADDDIIPHECFLSFVVTKPPWHIEMPFAEGAPTPSIPAESGVAA